MFKILVVEDDADLRGMFLAVLNQKGYSAIGAHDGEHALEIIEDSHVDLIISDVMMPKLDGFELTKALRESGYTFPILMITAKEKATDKYEGFRMGVDDYMVKPVDVNEMVFRVEALLRRSQSIESRKATIGSTVFDCDTLTVTSGDDDIILPQKEFLLIYKLITSPKRIFTRIQLMDEIWGPGSESDTHTLDVHVSRLREKFRHNEDFEIVTVRGLGYKAVRK